MTPAFNNRMRNDSLRHIHNGSGQPQIAFPSSSKASQPLTLDQINAMNHTLNSKGFGVAIEAASATISSERE